MKRILNLVPNCAYNASGVVAIWLLDFEDFNGYRYDRLYNYDKSFVESIKTSGDLIPLAAPGMSAKYSSSGAYVHTIETFIPSLDAQITEQLNLAIRRRYLVVFRTIDGKLFTFGDEAGAAVSYVNQTAEGTGAVVTISAQSIHPLYQASPDFFNNVRPQSMYVWPTNPGYYLCVGSGGFQYTTLMLRVDKDGNALDANGIRISISGNPQAVAALNGFPPSGPYQVVYIYPTGTSYIEGAATFRVNTTACPL